jgi:hypothetical protein
VTAAVASGTGGRAGALATVTDLLDLRPAPAGPIPGDRALLGVVAGRTGPRFLVPLDHPEAAPEACLAYLGLRERRTRATRGALGLALRAHLGGLVLRERVTADAGDGSLLALLGDLLADPGEEPGLAVAIGLSHADEVWKPTLQVFRPDGTPAAFVKVGVGPVAERLVATEVATLRAWGDHPDPRLVVPGLAAAATWRGHPLAVIEPLPPDARRLPPGSASPWPVRDLDGPPVEGTVAEAGWWTGRRAACADQAAVAEVLATIEDRHGDRAWPWARWHGDWVPWNLARCHRGLVAWDWEYSEPGAPVGLDEVHAAYQQARVAEGRSVAGALAAARAAASATVGARGTTPDPGAARWLADAHVAMLVSRIAELERLGGRPTVDHAHVLAAARGALR